MPGPRSPVILGHGDRYEKRAYLFAGVDRYRTDDHEYYTAKNNRFFFFLVAGGWEGGRVTGARTHARTHVFKAKNTKTYVIIIVTVVATAAAVTILLSSRRRPSKSAYRRSLPAHKRPRSYRACVCVSLRPFESRREIGIVYENRPSERTNCPPPPVDKRAAEILFLNPTRVCVCGGGGGMVIYEWLEAVQKFVLHLAAKHASCETVVIPVHTPIIN